MKYLRVTPEDVLLFAAYTLASVMSLLVIKAWLPVARTRWSEGLSLGLPTFLVFGGAALYVVSFLIWMVILTRHDLTFAYPTAIGLTLIFSSLAASFLLGETLSLARLGGMILIFIGILFVVRT
jgi:drug/metabolite transporter (DMT)-like permease